MLSAPDTSLSPPRYATSQGEDSSLLSTPSRVKPSQEIGLRQVKRNNTTADTSVPVLPSSSLAPSSVTSPAKNSTRRNSLSDLKIPSRISKAQTGIRNNISLVRDFAKGIEELKLLKASYLEQASNAPLRGQMWKIGSRTG